MACPASSKQGPRELAGKPLSSPLRGLHRGSSELVGCSSYSL
jgi:hypothetical protein